MSTVIPLHATTATRRSKPRLRDDDRLNLARAADSLLAAGHPQLAVYVIEVLYKLLDATATEATIIAFPSLGADAAQDAGPN
jgi:hypothetical protein